MFAAAAACSVVLAAVMALTAVQIATGEPKVTELLRRVRAQRVAPVVVATSAAGAVGLAAGMVVAPVGVAAAGGVLAQMAAAVVAHVRARDRNVAPAAVVATLAAITLALRAATF